MCPFLYHALSDQNDRSKPYIVAGTTISRGEQGCQDQKSSLTDDLFGFWPYQHKVMTVQFDL